MSCMLANYGVRLAWENAYQILPSKNFSARRHVATHFKLS